MWCKYMGTISKHIIKIPIAILKNQQISKNKLPKTIRIAPMKKQKSFGVKMIRKADNLLIKFIN